MKRMNIKMIDTEDIVNLALQALTRPEYFGYWGEEDMFITWGFTGIDKQRDSSIMQRSNFKTITDDLINRYPNDFKIETFSHWACGSIDRLICQILKEPGNYNENNITESFKAVLKWHDELNEYPIADENDYLNNLHDECVDYIENMADYLLLVTNTEEKGWAEKILHTLDIDLNFEFNPDYDQFPNDNKILEAILKSGLCNPERWGEWYEWCDEQGFDRPIFPEKENPNQLKLFED
jgi:hypothetical protein